MRAKRILVQPALFHQLRELCRREQRMKVTMGDMCRLLPIRVLLLPARNLGMTNRSWNIPTEEHGLESGSPRAARASSASDFRREFRFLPAVLLEASAQS